MRHQANRPQPTATIDSPDHFELLKAPWVVHLCTTAGVQLLIQNGVGFHGI
jgi:hypothetical protein